MREPCARIARRFADVSAVALKEKTPPETAGVFFCPVVPGQGLAVFPDALAVAIREPNHQATAVPVNE